MLHKRVQNGRPAPVCQGQNMLDTGFPLLLGWSRDTAFPHEFRQACLRSAPHRPRRAAPGHPNRPGASGCADVPPALLATPSHRIRPRLPGERDQESLPRVLRIAPDSGRDHVRPLLDEPPSKARPRPARRVLHRSRENEGRVSRGARPVTRGWIRHRGDARALADAFRQRPECRRRLRGRVPLRGLRKERRLRMASDDGRARTLTAGNRREHPGAGGAPRGIELEGPARIDARRPHPSQADEVRARRDRFDGAVGVRRRREARGDSGPGIRIDDPDPRVDRLPGSARNPLAVHHDGIATGLHGARAGAREGQGALGGGDGTPSEDLRGRSVHPRQDRARATDGGSTREDSGWQGVTGTASRSHSLWS